MSTSKSMTIVSRYLYPSNADISLDGNGLLQVSDSFRKYTSLISLEEFAELSGAILLAEGGMGKSTLMQQLKNQFPDGQANLVELWRYSGDPAGLREDITSFVQTDAKDSASAIIFDGLDEAVDLSGAVSRLIHDIPKTSTIWIASRDVAAIRSIQSELPQLKTYNLAPLSEQNIRDLAFDNDLFGDNFLKAVYRQGIAGICAKPLGCKLAISVFRDNGLADVSQRDLWHKGIRRLCDETPSATKRLASPSPYTLDQLRIDQDIKSALQQTKLTPESFGGIAAWLHSANGWRRLGPIDLRQSIGWGKLTSEEQNALIILAERYLKKGTIAPTAPNQHIYLVAQALTLLRIMKPGVYHGLTEDIWRKCSVELLKAAFNDHMEYLNPLFDTLSTNFPEVAETALLNVLNQELNGGCIFILGHWGERLSDKQAQSILQITKEPGVAPDKSFLILSKLVRHDQENLVRAYLDTLFNGNWESPPDQYLNKHLTLAFSLSPKSYVYQILEIVQANREWGRQWIETVVMDWEKGFAKGLFACAPDVIADTYIWLHAEYPANTCPEHEGAYSPEPLDEIHKLKSHIINHLTKSGINASTVALKQILHQFPEDTWLNNCIIEAQAAEQAKNIAIISIEDIKKLYDKKRASCRLINSAQDLHELVFEKLDEYQVFLQGDIPAIGDFWNSIVPIRPKDEECLSDHLARFLRLTLMSEIIINREVQIRRKLYEGGKSGSRTDIWIQATDENGQVLTLCIEVKCNWNASAKAALNDQLIKKYMSGGTAGAGILLLGWYACSDWDNDDSRQANSTKTWSDIDAARTDLDRQADQECKAGHWVSAKVIDCSLR